MLLTICPKCSAQFRVQPEQLNVRQGRVMCGRCRHVFNAFQSLSRVEETGETHAKTLQVRVATREPDREAIAPFSARQVSTELVADSLFLREEPSPLPAAFSASEPLPRVLLTSNTPSAGVAEASASNFRLAGNTAQEDPIFQHQARAVPRSEPGIDLSGEVNPLLVEEPSSRDAPTAAASRVWSVGVFLLFVGLLGQAAYAFRSTLVSNYPQLRPTLSELCEYAGCSLSWGRDEAALKIEASELIEAPGKPGRILLTAILVNRGKSKQDLPSLELRLTDTANQVVVSRLLHPADYLGRVIAKDEGLVPNTELYVNVDLKLELNNKPPASGYGLIVFYP